jgi:hypothetical protein
MSYFHSSKIMIDKIDGNWSGGRLGYEGFKEKPSYP